MVITLSLFSSVLLYLTVFGLSSAAIKSKGSPWMRVVLVSALPFILGGLRYNVGWDYGSYLWGFELIEERSWESILAIDQFLSFSTAFYIVEKLIRYTRSNFLFFAVTSALCYLPAILYIIRDWDKSDDEYNIASRSLFLYLIWFYTFGYSAIKQGIAIGVCLFSLTYVFERKPVKFLLTIILAALFHPSAIVFVVVYFLWNSAGTLSGWKKVVTSVLCFIFIVGFDFLIGTFGGIYSKYAGMEVEGRNLTFWIMCIWALIFFIYRERLVRLDKRNELLIVIFAIGTAIQFLGFTNAFVKRVGQYFLVTECILLPQLVCIFTRRSRQLGWWLIVAANVFLFIMQNNAAADVMGILPYKFIFWQ